MARSVVTERAPGGLGSSRPPDHRARNATEEGPGWPAGGYVGRDPALVGSWEWAMRSGGQRGLHGEGPASPEEWAEFAAMRGALDVKGWLCVPGFQPEDDAGEKMLRFARTLGRPYRVPGADPLRPVVDSRASVDAPYEAPFDRLEAIGWHNDFSTHRARPRWSLSYVRREDRAGGGNWRVAAIDRVLAGLGHEEGAVLRLLRERLPYSFSDQGALSWHRGLVRGRLRFYGRALRDGARRAYGSVPVATDELIRSVERTADREAAELRAESGALLVVDNGRVLHDRTEQTAGDRRVVLAFVVG